MECDKAPIYFVLREGYEQEDGPYTLEEVRARVASGILKETDLFAVSGMEEWKEISELEGPRPEGAKTPAIRSPWPQGDKSESSKRRGVSRDFVSGCVLVLVVIGIAWWRMEGGSDSQSKTGGQMERDALAKARQLILDEYPGAEKFKSERLQTVPSTEFHANDGGGGVNVRSSAYEARFVVDGKNAFGGPVRKVFRVEMHRDGDEWRAGAVWQE